jgi:hypothetical protein
VSTERHSTAKPPPFLIGAALLFWGWQSGFPLVGALMALVLEAPQFTRARWDFSNQDFSRIWTFCALLFLASAVLAFTSNEGPADFRSLLFNPSIASERNAGNATARTTAALFRWLPMLFFLFLAAQRYSSREGVPLETISLILSGRWKRAKKLGLELPPGKSVDVSYPYFGLCLLASSVHPTSEDNYFYWGMCALLAWALWPQRSRRFALPIWAAALACVVLFGYLGQRGVGQLSRYIMNINPQWFMNMGRGRFDWAQSRTSIGQIGRIKNSGQIVIRLESTEGPPPAYLREASYRSYKGQTWSSEMTEGDFQRVVETNETSWVLLPEKPTIATVEIGCYIEHGRSLLPLPSGSARLEKLRAYILEKNPLGAVAAQGPGVVVFDARFGPGQTMDTPPVDKDDLLPVPPREADALQQVVDELHLKGQPLKQALQTLERFFQEKFTYRTWQPPSFSRTNESPLTRFLLRTRAGHCEYFATAGVLLLRKAGFPARYAVGYAVHEGARGKYVVRQRDAHSWCLVWNQNANHWQDFDPTPASWMEAEGSRASNLQFLTDFWSRIKFELAKFRWGQTHLRQYILTALIPILAFLLYRILFRSRRGRAGKGKEGDRQIVVWPGLDSEFYQLEKKLQERGIERGPGEPLAYWLRRASENPALADLRGPLESLLRLHYRYRFDPQGLALTERELLKHEAGVCLAKV